MKFDKTLLALAATVLLWASAFPAIRVALDGLGPAQLSLLRLAVASAALAAAAPVLKVRRPARADLWRIAVIGVTGMSAYQLLLNWGEVHVPAGTASLIVAAVPAMSALLAVCFAGERLTRAKAGGSLVALTGAVLIAVSGKEHGYTAAAWAVLGAALSQAVYHLTIKPLLRRHTGLEVAAYATWAGTALLVPLAPSTFRALLDAPAGSTAAAVYLGLLPSAAGFVAWGYAVARLSITTATAALYLVPVATLGISYLWLGEHPRPAAVIGGLVIIAGLLLLNKRPHPTAPEPPAPPGLPGHQVDAARHRQTESRSPLTEPSPGPTAAASQGRT
ncbi:drug/metabolite transporter (DMT)-like permease [Actinocorallia herbida]|uniref:Drug/metabolite transporter (DMT)-like permease n=1 Tax=Actinocorallia herbida TaxID=58109 RepID=A0A3N1D2C2_9ACTN|nr:DMT family transporter [Actinocorallia herbida]ROO87679.1 drug/metabolite transporter (DMT)-like permease [Actinocorallia herbida]